MMKVKIKSYSKTELAMFYVPDVQPASARRTLRSWINFNSDLKKELIKVGYREKSKILTPIQVGLIFRYLGKP